MCPDSTQPTGPVSTDAVDDEPRTAPHAEPLPTPKRPIRSSRRRSGRVWPASRSRPRRSCKSGIALVGVAAVGPRQRCPRVARIRRLGLRPQEPRAGRRRSLTVGVVAPAGDRAVVGAKSVGIPGPAAHRRDTLPRRWPLRLHHRPQSRDQPKGQGRSQWAQYPQQAAAPRAPAAGYGSCARGTLSRL